MLSRVSQNWLRLRKKARVKEGTGVTAAADIVKEDTIVTGRSAQTRLTGKDSVVEPDSPARHL